VNAKKLHRDALVCDLHTDALYEHVSGRRDIVARSSAGHVDIPRLQEGGVNGQVFAIWPSPEKFRSGEFSGFALGACAAFTGICGRVPAKLAHARTPEEFDAAVQAGKVAGVLGVEGAHALDGRLEMLDRFSEFGVRVLTLTWNNSNELADAALDKTPPHGGLSALGRSSVRRCNELGIVIDLSHASEKTFFDTLDTTAAPVIASHSGVKALCDFPRNLSDGQLRALVANGGMVGIVFLPYFLRPGAENADIADVLAAIDHACAVAGPAHVGIGSDFDGYGGVTAGLEDVTKMGAITAGLVERGYPESDIRLILGENFRRVWGAVASRAAQQPAVP
jgi:membrane dipeptidase